jgi:hypothetical protein
MMTPLDREELVGALPTLLEWWDMGVSGKRGICASTRCFDAVVFPLG